VVNGYAVGIELHVEARVQLLVTGRQSPVKVAARAFAAEVRHLQRLPAPAGRRDVGREFHAFTLRDRLPAGVEFGEGCLLEVLGEDDARIAGDPAITRIPRRDTGGFAGVGEGVEVAFGAQVKRVTDDGRRGHHGFAE